MMSEKKKEMMLSEMMSKTVKKERMSEKADCFDEMMRLF